MTLTIKPSNTVNKEVTILCDCCRLTTVHLIVAAVDYRATSHDEEFIEWGTAQVTKCQGCEILGFRQIYRTNENPEIIDELLFPVRKKHRLVDHLYLRDNAFRLPKTVQTIYFETLSAIQNDLLTLAGIGVRTVIEVVCRQLKTKKRNLVDKIDELVTQSFLSRIDAEILHRIRLLGNDAAHKMRAPTIKQITAAMKVIDHLLMGVYILPKESSVLPRRRLKSHIVDAKAHGCIGRTNGLAKDRQ